MSPPKFTVDLLHPKYWLTWFGFGIWYLLTLLPYGLLMSLGNGLGSLLYPVAGYRRKVIEANLRLCFPQLSEKERRARVRANMKSLGRAVMETGIAWFWSPQRLRQLISVSGKEHLLAAKASGSGIVLMTHHVNHLDLCLKMVGMEWPIDGFYRAHKNPVYEYMQRRGREKHTSGGKAIAREDLRTMVKSLRGQRTVAYIPDQDFGAKHSTFVDFFGVPAATVTATSRLVKMGKSELIPFVSRRKKSGEGYELIFSPALEDFPSDNVDEDCLRLNQIVEAGIMLQPDEYLWAHRRFKTRPEQSPDLYLEAGVPPKKRRKRRRK